MKTKVCSKCKIEKQANGFTKNIGKKSGLSSQCKECQKRAREKSKEIVKIINEKHVPQLPDKERAKLYAEKWNKFRMSMGNATFKRNELIQFAKGEKLPYYILVPNKLEEKGNIEIVDTLELLNSTLNIYKFTGKPIEWLLFMDIFQEKKSGQKINNNIKNHSGLSKDEEVLIDTELYSTINGIPVPKKYVETLKKSLKTFVLIDNERDKMKEYVRVCYSLLDIIDNDVMSKKLDNLEEERDLLYISNERLEEENENLEKQLKERDKEIFELHIQLGGKEDEILELYKENKEMQNRYNKLVDKYIYDV